MTCCGVRPSTTSVASAASRPASAQFDPGEDISRFATTSARRFTLKRNVSAASERALARHRSIIKASLAIDRSNTSMRTGLGSTQSTESFSGVSNKSSIHPEITITLARVRHCGHAQVHDDNLRIGLGKQCNRPATSLRGQHLMTRLLQHQFVEIQKLR